MAKRLSIPHTPEFTTLRLELIRRGWMQADLAKAAGLAEAYVSTVLRGIRTSKAARIKVEDALGVCAWSTPEEFAKRRKANQAKAAKSSREVAA